MNKERKKEIIKLVAPLCYMLRPCCSFPTVIVNNALNVSVVTRFIVVKKYILKNKWDWCTVTIPWACLAFQIKVNYIRNAWYVCCSSLLDNNPLECDCGVTTSLWSAEVTGTCAQPPRLRGVEVATLLPEDFVCGKLIQNAQTSLLWSDKKACVPSQNVQVSELICSLFERHLDQQGQSTERPFKDSIKNNRFAFRFCGRIFAS